MEKSFQREKNTVITATGEFIFKNAKQRLFFRENSKNSKRIKTCLQHSKMNSERGGSATGGDDDDAGPPTRP